MTEQDHNNSERNVAAKMKIKESSLGLVLWASRFFAKDVVNDGDCYNRQEKSYLCLSNLLSKIDHFCSKISSAFIARLKDNIAATTFKVKVIGCLVTSIAISQAATRSEQIAEKTLSCGFVGSKENFIMQTVTQKYLSLQLRML